MNDEGEAILFFDTETTGTPTDWNAPPEEWPRLVQLGYIVTTPDGEHEIHRGNKIVKPNGFKIPSEAESVHGISTEKAQNEGSELKDVMSSFKKWIEFSGLIVCHNFEFDSNVVNGESSRLWNEYITTDTPSICTMKSQEVNQEFMPGKGSKWPKLQELHEEIFDERFDGAHDAMKDIEATANCFFHLFSQDILDIPETVKSRNQKIHEAATGQESDTKDQDECDCVKCRNLKCHVCGEDILGANNRIEWSTNEGIYLLLCSNECGRVAYRVRTQTKLIESR